MWILLTATYFFPFVLPLIGLILSLYRRVRIYKVFGQKLTTFTPNIKYASMWNAAKPEGWVSGAWFVGYIDHNVLIVMCTTEFFETKVNMRNIGAKEIVYWDRDGAFDNLMYYDRIIDPPQNEPTPDQNRAIAQLFEVYKQKKYARALICGATGTKKSSMARYLARALLNNFARVHFCKSFNPFQPGDTMGFVYRLVKPTYDAPLIILLDEIDVYIQNIHNGATQISRTTPTPIADKTGWNGFLDDFEMGIYPFIFLILTSNKDFNYFDALDPSYMREGRIDCWFYFKH